METRKVLGICGSLRRASSNHQLLRYAKENAPDGMQISIADLSEVPLYNADIETTPPAVEALFAQLENSR